MVVGTLKGSWTSVLAEEEERPSAFIAVTLQSADGPDSVPELSQQLHEGLVRSLEGSGYQQSGEAVEAEYSSTLHEWRVVAPGMIVRPSEYESRYGFLDLPSLRERMKPPVFLAFVRSIGIIDAIPDTDVNDLFNQEVF